MSGCSSWLLDEKELDVAACGTDSHRGISATISPVRFLWFHPNASFQAEPFGMHGSPLEFSPFADRARCVRVVVSHASSSGFMLHPPVTQRRRSNSHQRNSLGLLMITIPARRHPCNPRNPPRRCRSCSNGPCACWGGRRQGLCSALSPVGQGRRFWIRMEFLGGTGSGVTG
mgnify:FL=1